MLTGQIYRVGFTGRLRKDGKTHELYREMAMIGTSPEDVRSRFTFMFDVSDYDDYRLDFVVKEPDRYVVLRSESRCIEHQEPDAVIGRKERTENVIQNIGQFRSPGHGKYAVMVNTVLHAGDEKHARKKLGRRILEQPDDPRLSWDVCVQHVADGFAMPRDVSMFTRASVIGLRE